MTDSDTALYITVLLYLVPGQEQAFAEYEAYALDLLVRHGGQVVCRVRPSGETFLAPGQEHPYEIQVLAFPSSAIFEQFMQDPARQARTDQRRQAIRETLLITGRVNR
ncbi:DUF1330 domain-containing protein [Hymenobacter sp.]|uniref:DUF1330 domain-containing protein n=1 Tax=Hymenobacter sp. TaxID=1898978 RepID=UPI00286C771F|nr:DUF1330 domain-containing protein [Hymenobacter sp.]